MVQQKLPYDQPIIHGYETRDAAALASAINAPFQTAGRKDCYRGLAGKSAALFYFLAKGHAFKNGNKRIAVTALLTLLHKNGKWVNASVEDLIGTAVLVANSNPKKQERTIKILTAMIKKFLMNFSELFSSVQ